MPEEKNKGNFKFIDHFIELTQITPEFFEKIPRVLFDNLPENFDELLPEI